MVPSSSRAWPGRQPHVLTGTTSSFAGPRSVPGLCLVHPPAFSFVSQASSPCTNLAPGRLHVRAVSSGPWRAAALPFPLRLRFLSPGGCLPVFSLCFLLLFILLLGCNCVTSFFSPEVHYINIMMAPSGSPALPGRRAPLR